MNEVEIRQYMTDTFEGVDSVDDSDATFYFYNPDSSVPPNHDFPFVTVVTGDKYDQFSDLNRPSVFRVNIGVSKQTFRSLFGPAEPAADSKDAAGKYDFTNLDQVMPHPVYGMMYWVCVLNPGPETFETRVRPLLAEAYEMAVSKYQKQAASR